MHRRFYLLFIIFPLISGQSLFVHANDQASGVNYFNKRYVTAGFAFNEFQDITLYLVESSSINEEFGEDTLLAAGFYPNLKAHTYSLGFSYGWYLDDTFKTEWRYAKGIRSDKLKNSYEVNINHLVSWYLGAQQPITDYLKAYLNMGLSYYTATVKRNETVIFNTVTQNSTANRLFVQPSPYRNEKGLFGTNFSLSWMLGMDIRLKKDTYLTVEYGRLLKDTDTAIEVHQFGTHLKFEF